MKRSALSLGIAAVLSLSVGCGGGGSSDGSAPATNSASTTISGKAAKGVVSKGTVTAYELDSSGKQLRSVGTAVTADDGSYEIKLGADYEGGPIKLVITSGADSLMKCDVLDGCKNGNATVAFGGTLKLPDGFSMNAVVPPQSAGTKVKAQITPLSHMAAARALKSATVDAAAIKTAISEVNEVAGVNIQTTEPVDITGSDLAGASNAAKQYALYAAGLASVLMNDDDKDLNTKLDDLAASFEDGKFDADDEISITTITDSVAETSQKASEKAELKVAMADAITSTKQIVEVTKNQVKDGGFDPEPSKNADKSEVQQAKALVAETRTFINNITENYSEPLDALDVDMETVSSLLDKETTVMLEVLTEALDQASDYLDAEDIDLQTAVKEGETYEVPIKNASKESAGDLKVAFSDSDGISVTLNGKLTTADDTEISFTDLKLATSLTLSDFTISDEGEVTQLIWSTKESVNLTGTVSNSADTSINFKNVEFIVNSSAGSTIAIDNEASESAADDKVTDVALGGEIEISAKDSKSFSGKLGAKLVALNDKLKAESKDDETLSLANLELSGTFSSAAKVFDASVKLDISNATDFDLFGYLDKSVVLHGYQSISAAAFSDQISKFKTAYAGMSGNNGRVIDEKSISMNAYPESVVFRFDYSSKESSAEANVQQKDTYSDASLWPALKAIADEQLKTALKDDERTEGRVIDTKAINYSAGYVGAHYKAEFEDLETADKFIKGQLTVTAALKGDDLAQTRVTATAERTALEEGKVTLTVAKEGKTYTLTADSKTNLVLSNADGVKVNFKLDDNDDSKKISGKAFVGETEVATISTTDKDVVLIRYADGTLESL